MPKKTTDTLIEMLKDLNDEMKEIRKEFKQHKEEMEPIISGWQTIQGVRSFVVWIAGLLLSFGAITAFFKSLN